MGFNISGITINKNYKDNLSELETVLGEKLYFEKEVNFEEGSENWKDDSYCDIYFSEKGTLVFMSMERCGFDFYANEQDLLSFVLSEMSMTFSINYVKSGKLIRTIMESEDEVMDNEGEPLDFETNEDDKSELIYHLFEETLGKSFHDIELEEKCLRFQFKPIPQTSSVKTKGANTPEKKEEKPWWKFW